MNELHLPHTETGATIRAQIYQTNTRNVRDVVAGAWVDAPSATMQNTLVTTTEVPGTKQYYGDLPAGLDITSTDYTVVFWSVASATNFQPTTDDVVGNQLIGPPIGSRLAANAYTAPDNTSVAAIKLKTDNLPADPASNTQVNTRMATFSWAPPDNASIGSILTILEALPIDIASNTNLNAKFTALTSQITGLNFVAPDNASIATIKLCVQKLPMDPASDTTVLTRMGTFTYIVPDNASIATILAATNNLPNDPASNTVVNTRLAASAFVAPDNTSIAAIKTQTDRLPADPASNTQVNTRMASFVWMPPANDLIAAIKLSTDNLPIDPASITALNTRMAAENYVPPNNTAIAAIQASTSNLPADPASNTVVNTRLAASVISLDGQGRVLLQPLQPGVTIPAVTALTNQAVLTADQVNAIVAAIWSNTARTVTGGTVDNVTNGVNLAATGLDAIDTSIPTGVPTTFRGMLVLLFRRFFGTTSMTSTQLQVCQPNGTPITTQVLSQVNGTQTVGEAA